MCKTIAGLQIAKANAAAGNGVCDFSLEMAVEPMMLRLACDMAFDRSAPYYSGEPSCPTIERAINNRLTFAE